MPTRELNLAFFRMLQQDCPNGRLTPAKFVDMYKMFFPSGNAEEFCDHVFRTFDMDKNGYIDFKVSTARFFTRIGADCCSEACNDYRASSEEDTRRSFRPIKHNEIRASLIDSRERVRAPRYFHRARENRAPSRRGNVIRMYLGRPGRGGGAGNPRMSELRQVAVREICTRKKTMGSAGNADAPRYGRFSSWHARKREGLGGGGERERRYIRIINLFRDFGSHTLSYPVVRGYKFTSRYNPV